MKKRRADEALVSDLGLESIALARALIMEGRVMAGDRKILRASELLKPGDALRVRGELDAYVSRGAHKLKKALEVFGIDLNGSVCVDVGASTGGFTDVMLRAGAGRVYSVDVGYNLLDYRLRSDARVVCMERTNARFLTPEAFDPRPDFGATDVSFISLKAVLPAALGVLAENNQGFVALVKPQFEAVQSGLCVVVCDAANVRCHCDMTRIIGQRKKGTVISIGDEVTMYNGLPYRDYYDAEKKCWLRIAEHDPTDQIIKNFTL